MSGCKFGVIRNGVSTTDFELNPNPARRILHLEAHVGAGAVAKQLFKVRRKHSLLAAACPTRRRLSDKPFLQKCS
jgi:hypothetical protein